MRRPDFIARQSRCPSGLLGRLIGRVMATETARENEAAIALLDLQPTDRVLEVGFGHGRTLARVASTLTRGVAVGIDHSEAMVRAATRRCGRLLRDGRVVLQCGDSARLPFPDGHFDKAYAVHTIYFWPQPSDHLKEIHRVLRPGGRIVLGFRSKEHGTTEDFPPNVYVFYGIEDVRRMLADAGFDRIETHTPSRLPGGLVVVAARRA